MNHKHTEAEMSKMQGKDKSMMMKHDSETRNVKPKRKMKAKR